MGSKRKWDNEKVISEIQSRHLKGLPLNSNYQQLHNRSLYNAACRYFGGWKQAVDAADLSYSKIRIGPTVKSWTKKTIVDEIKSRKKVGLPINGQAVHDQDRGLYNAAARIFGINGWKKALDKAGVNPGDINPLRKWTKREIVRRIKSLHKQQLPLTQRYMDSHGECDLVAGSRRLFGSWRKAIEEAGLEPKKVLGSKKKHNWWTKNRVTARIRYLNNGGLQLDSRGIQSTHSALFSAARLYFGSWSKAVYAAGIDYQEHCKVWSSQAWLSQLQQADIDELKSQSIELAQRRINNDHENR